MSMQKIAVQIEKKRLLGEFGILEKLFGEEQKTVGKEEILQAIDEIQRELLEEISYLKGIEEPLIRGEYDLSLFDKDILCEDSKIILRRPIDDDCESYYLMKKEYAYMKYLFTRAEYKDELWREYLSDESLYYTIARKVDNAFIGYCGVKNMNRKIWEIAIEIKSGCCRQGYGYRALKMYLETVAKISNRHEFVSRVEADNIVSQNLMEKIGFQPYGLSEFLLHKEEDKLAAEEEYKDELNDRYIELAKKFNVEPRKLLSHVLEYILHVG